MAKDQYEDSGTFTEDLNLLVASLAKAKEIMGKREFVHWMGETDQNWPEANVEDYASELLEAIDEAVDLSTAFNNILCNLG